VVIESETMMNLANESSERGFSGKFFIRPKSNGKEVNSPKTREDVGIAVNKKIFS
jgi:hypothetical protein